MDLYVNGEKLDIQLEDEKTVGDVLKAFEEECSKNNSTTVNICVDGKNVSPDDFDAVSKENLDNVTTIELIVVSQTAVENSFKELKGECSSLGEEIKTLAAKFQSGKDREANAVITSLADLIDSVCHTASLSMLFPERFGSIKIDGKTFSEFFADFSEILKEFERAVETKDTVLIGDLGEYEISPRLEQLAAVMEE